jgi:hypothetical protein
MTFEIVGSITEIETIAVENGIREIAYLRAQFGQGRWRKLKGRATVHLSNDTYRLAEVHWYEAQGIGRRRMKIKQFLD